MTADERIRKLQEFVEDNYKAQLLEASSTGKTSLNLNFTDLSKFDPQIAEELINSPEDILKEIEIACRQLDLPTEAKPKIRISGLPTTQNIPIRNIRSAHIGKLLVIEGLVRQKSDVRPQVVSSKFECPSCGQIMSIIQVEQNFREPTKCSCGRKGKFNLLNKELVDAQSIVLEERPESLVGGEQPKRLTIFLKEDLVSPITEKRTNPGSKITVIGQLREIPRVLKTGGKSTMFDIIIEANNVEASEEDFYDIRISKEEQEKILVLSKDPNVYEKLIGSIAPSIFGYEKVKEALLLQLAGGVIKKRKDEVTTRGDIHILLVGDPGAGKSQILKRISKIAPKARYVSGKGASGAGMTAAVVRDEFLGGWSLEAGALVLANNGLCCLDELDKMAHEDRVALHEAMEQQTISISKANIHATLLTRTTVLAAANPKLGRFDPYGVLADQIDLPPTLINRFDLIFPIQDKPDPTRDERMAKHILFLHQDPESMETDIPTDLLKKYVAYVRQHGNPVLTDAALNEIKDFYVSMRGMGATDSKLLEGRERTVRAIPISARQLEALVRLAEASAKIRMDREVTKKDAKRAIELLTYCLMQVGFDKETGTIDIDRLSTSMPASRRNKIFMMRDIIRELEEHIGGGAGGLIPVGDLLKTAVEKGMQEAEAEEIIRKLRTVGEIYEPQPGFIKKL